MRQVYFDYNATTPVDPEVLEAMLPYLKEGYGNPSSVHWAGRVAKAAISEARESVASLFTCSPDELVFCGCGTEALNFAIKGSWFQRPDKRHFITTPVEHNGVAKPHSWLESQGAVVTYLDVDTDGRINLDQLRDSIRPDTNLISIMMANNETGIMFPVEEISEIAKEKGVLFFCDAVQAVGKRPINLKEFPVDFLAFSGHKFYAPKGAAGLFIRNGLRLNSLIHGGGHERGRRAGTENVAGIVGLGKAAELALKKMEKSEGKLRGFQKKIETALEAVEGAKVVGATSERMPNTTNVVFDGVDGELLLTNLDLEGIALSSGSACSSGLSLPPRVLMAMGFPEELARTSLRISYGVPTTEEEVDFFLKTLLEIVSNLKNSPQKEETLDG
ncbi:cysteine desulfurase family protein [Bdellovibrionota bacterium]